MSFIRPMFLVCKASIIVGLSFLVFWLGYTSLMEYRQHTPKYELARRAQCIQNMKRVSIAISNFKSATGKWPSLLSELNMRSIPVCPSAGFGDTVPGLDGHYAWEVGGLKLIESEENHRVRRFDLDEERLPNVTHIVVFDAAGDFRLETLEGETSPTH